MSGYILLHRAVFDHPFEDQKYSEREAWIWLLCEAAHTPHRKRVNGREYEVGRGQLVMSNRFLARAWGWSEAAVRRFLRRLVDARMLSRDTRTKVTQLTICNYSKYQVQPQTDDATATQQRRKLNKGNTGDISPPIDPPDDFDRFWEAFDHKKARRSAERAWAASLKRGNDPAKLISAAAEYRRSKPDKQFMKHPATWLNADCQNDEIETSKPEPRNEHSTKPHSTILAGFGEALRRTGSVALRDTDTSGGGRVGAAGNALGRGEGEGTPRQIEAPRGGQRSEGAGYGRAHGGVPRSAD